LREEEWREKKRQQAAEQRAKQNEMISRRQAFASEHKFVAMSAANAPEWAKGCERCDFGVIGMEHATGPLPMFLMRAVLAERHIIEFCDCRAGHMARQHARRIYTTIKEGNERISPALMEIVNAWIEDHSMPTFNGKTVTQHWTEER
jgi:hypothetical protein